MGVSGKCSGLGNLIISNETGNLNGRFISKEGRLVSDIIEIQ